ncbi:MAG: tail fiber domain-containing protein, partial [Candidatus Scalindua sediminis]
SDVRLKKDIITIENALDKVEKLRGVQFEWKDITNHPEGKQIGFIAQEAKEIIPEVVSKKGKNLSMQYAPITALLVEAVKELKTENETFKRENEQLREKLTALADRLEAIDEMLLP